MSRLRYLTLIFSRQSSINSRLFNGYEWASFISASLPYLKRFDLKLPFHVKFASSIHFHLHLFHTSWWLNEKQWYIEYVSKENALMTVPYFLSKILDHFDLNVYDGMLYPKIFYSNIVELKLNSIEFAKSSDGNCCHQFSQVKRLSFNGPLTEKVFDRIQSYVNLEKIEHFQYFSQSDGNDGFLGLMNKMTNLSSLHIQYKNVLHLFRQFRFPLFNIRHLVLFDYRRRTMKRLFIIICSLFPRLTHLETSYHNRRIFLYLLRNLLFLEELNFRLTAHKHVPNHHWIASKTPLKSDSFLSEIFNVDHAERIFLLWLHRHPQNQLDLMQF